MNSRYINITISFLVSSTAAIMLFPYILWSPEVIARHGLFLDDAYFYSVIAKNFQSLGFFSFDGEMPTNGVQPLWMIIQIVLVKLFPGAGEVKLLALSSWLLYCSFVFLFVNFVVSRTPDVFAKIISASMVSGIVLNGQFQQMVVNGLEIPLVLLIFTLAIVLMAHIDKEADRDSVFIRKKYLVLLALSSALCFLTRTDLFFISLIIGGWIYCKRGLSRDTFIFAFVVLLLVLPYVSYNYITQGHLMPISGRVKLFFLEWFYPAEAQYWRSDEWFGLFEAFTRFFPWINQVSLTNKVIYTLAVVGLSQVIIWNRRFSAAFPTGIKLMSLAVILHTIFMYVFYRELRPYSSYYFVPEILIVSLIFILFLQNQWSKKSGKIHAACSAFLLAAAAMFSIGIVWMNFPDRDYVPLFWDQRISMARDLDTILPADATVCAFWPGAFAQFSNRRVRSLDGIIGSEEFFMNYVKTGKEIDYCLEQNNQVHIIIYLPGPWEDILKNNPPPIPTWSYVGMVRLWEKRKYEMKVLKTRIIHNETQEGWYLIAISKQK